MTCRRVPALALVVLLALTACGDSDSTPEPAARPTFAPGAVPAEMKPACGNPAGKVTLKKNALPLTIAQADCDLRGVLITWREGSERVPGGDPRTATECTSAAGDCPSIAVDALGTVQITRAGDSSARD